MSVKGRSLDLSRALKILEIRTYSEPEDLKKAFRALAHRYHPDKNPRPEAGELFRDVLEAYQFCLENLEVLTCHFGLKPAPELLSKDRLVIENLDDIFEDIFGFTRAGRVLGYQEPHALGLTLKEFLFGGAKIEKLPAYESCRDCRGVGASQGTLARLCRHCFGKGYYLKKNGREAKRKLCPQCQGRGREMEKPCLSCGGFGRLKRIRRQKFALPLGMTPGGLYTLAGADEKTGQATEIFIQAFFVGDSIFQIDNYDLLCEYLMDFSRHKTSVILNFETPFGKKALEIPQAAKSGDVMIVPNAGLYKNGARTEQGVLKITLKQKKPSLLKRVFGGWLENQ